MSIWNRLGETISNLTHIETLGHLFDDLRSEPQKSMRFTIAIVALGAKTAKADGLVTKDEVTAFREVFLINAQDEKNAATVFNLARKDTAGYETYAAQIYRLMPEDHDTLEHILEGLFHIAVADHEYHPQEDDFIHHVAELFHISESRFRAIRARFVPDAKKDPYAILGVSPDMSLADIKSVWRKEIRNTHPDQLVAKGLPEEAIKIATKRMIDLNEAWEDIYHEHGAV